MNCIRRCLLGFLILAVGVGGPVVAVFIFAASWLLQSDHPQAADAIVVLAGDARRARYAADLFRQGLARKVLVSRPAPTAREKLLSDLAIPFPRGEQVDFWVLQKTGVEAGNIEFFGGASLSTFDEAIALQRQFVGQSPRLLVVTSPYHVRRARMILANAMPNAILTVCATPYEQFPAQWWRSQDAARDLLLESAKLAFYFLGGRFSSVEQR
jgi:uncharacterized SAM-binding protein YcdF (DUF218 family)